MLAQGMKKWTKIAKTIKDSLGIDSRTGKQCRERWHNHLNPDINKDDWSPEEEMRVFELQKQLGNKWSEIADLMPGRTDNSIKNCFYSAIRRNLRKYNKKKPESEKLKGSLKNLLKRPAIQAILMKSSFRSDAKESFEKRISLNSEIIIPIIQPLTPMSVYQYPITPSTTQSILSSKLSSMFFNFPDETSTLERSLINCENIEDVFSQETISPHYFMPQFTPKDAFHFYFTPRNSNSK